MLPALGHCEDLECQSTSHESVRLFRCSIHCDRNVCLFHLNAHNVYYEEEKKQNNIVINELQNSLNLYQTIFEKQIVIYRELVRQASTILLQNTSSLVPLDQIRSILEKLQQAVGVFHEEKIIIKCESMLDTNEIENKTTSNNHASAESGQKVVVRIPRLDCNKSNVQSSDNEKSFENDENSIKLPDENEEQRNSLPAYVTRKAVDARKKRSTSVKRLQK